MRLRSTVNLLIFFVVSALILNLVFGLFKQIISQKKINLYLEQRKIELRKLEEENIRLKEKLAETEKPDFLNNEASRLFGLAKEGFSPDKQSEEEKPKTEPIPTKIPNWQKWVSLFKF